MRCLKFLLIQHRKTHKEIGPQVAISKGPKSQMLDSSLEIRERLKISSRALKTNIDILISLYKYINSPLLTV